MNLIVINTKLPIVHAQKLTWTLKKRWCGRPVSFQPMENFGVHVLRGCNHSTLETELFRLDSLLRCLDKVPQKSSLEMVVTFMVMNPIAQSVFRITN